MQCSDTFFLDNFAQRQWEQDSFGQIKYDKQQFVDRIEAYYQDNNRQLVGGYADFCKHIFIPNFVQIVGSIAPITPENQHTLKSGYIKRRKEELAVLSRWFPLENFTPQPAKFLDIILYSRQQLLKEYKALPYEQGVASDELPQCPWGIISIKPQDENYETPMQPITMLRNALGQDQGGSGVALNIEQYEKAVEYWDKHAIAK